VVSGVLDARQARGWVDGFLAAIDREAAGLGELDRRSGDGDYGANLQAGARKIRARLARAPATVGGPFDAVSEAFLDTGGTSGPLFGMFFRALAKAGAGRDEIDLATLAKAAGDGLATIQRLGGAQPGDKTMVDALVPAVDALRAGGGGETASAVAAAARAARAGAESTGELVARRGRASYVGEAARGVPDPGALTVALLFDAGSAVFDQEADHHA